MFKFLLSFISLALACSVANASYSFTVEANDNARTVTITGVVNPDQIDGDLAIPGTWNVNGSLYTVNSIASNAIHDLAKVRRITIPASIESIGFVSSKNLTGVCRNFYNCPELIFISVDKNNKLFSSDDRGILYSAHSSVINRCPAKVTVTGGKLSFKGEKYDIGADAFEAVTSVNSLEFERVGNIAGNAGLNTMPWLASINVTASDSPSKSIQGVLVSANGCLVSFPARMVTGNYTVPDQVKTIGEYAFSNTIYPSSVKMGSVTAIEKGAFQNSNIKQAGIPATVTQIGSFTFYNCRSLTSIIFKGNVSEVPRYFALDCPALKEVKYEGSVPATIGDGAFRNCTSLTTHRFSYSQLGDSVFCNTGFTDVVYEKFNVADHPQDIFAGRAAFADCHSLKSIDMRAAVTSDRERLMVPSFFTSGCESLEKVVLPSYVSFAQTSPIDGICPAFTGNPRLMTIIMGSFNRTGGSPVFSYSGNRTYKPLVYVRNSSLPDISTSLDPFRYVWNATGGATVKPIFYWESLRPQQDYVVEGGSYYVPGGSLENFSEAIEAGCYVEECFRLKLGTEDGCLTISLGEIYPDMIRIKEIQVDNAVWSNPDYGTFNTGLPFSDVENMWITYTAHGEELRTHYDRLYIQISGVDDIPASDENTAPRYFNLQGIETSVPMPGNIYIVKRGTAVTKEIVR